MAVRHFLALALMTRCGAQEVAPSAVDVDAPITRPADEVPMHSGRRLQTSSDFSCVNIPSSLVSASVERKFKGAAEANGMVYFAPDDADCIGVVNLTDLSFSCINIPLSSDHFPYGGRNKFAGATTASNGHIIFAPNFAECVGIYDPANSVFNCVSITGRYTSYSSVVEDSKFRGATTAPNGLVILVPRMAKCVGVFNPANHAFSCVDISSIVNGGHTFAYGALTTNGVIVFGPAYADCVGIYDPSNEAFSCVDISITLDRGFRGATTANNGLVIFAPLIADCVGVFDPATNAFSCVDISSSTSAYFKFAGATTGRNGLVYLAPLGADCVGIFDPATNAFSCVDISSFTSTSEKFRTPLATSHGHVIFAPVKANCIGVLAVHAPPSPPAMPSAQDGAIIEMTGNDPKLIFGTLENPTCQLSIDRPNSRLVSTCAIQDSRRLEETFDCEAKYSALEQKYKALQSEVFELRRLVDMLKAT